MNVAARLLDRSRKNSIRISKHDLSARRAGLLKLMQSINFGHIEILFVADGEPILDPPPRIIREVTIHHGRHTFISHALAGGRSLAEVRAAAGHSNISVTSAYLHIVVDDDEPVGNLFRFPPVD